MKSALLRFQGLGLGAPPILCHNYGAGNRDMGEEPSVWFKIICAGKGYCLNTWGNHNGFSVKI